MSRKRIYYPKSGEIVGACVFVREDGFISESIRQLRAAIFKCNYCNKEFRGSFNRVNNMELKSCGCYRKTQLSIRSITHGLSKTKEYAIWRSMKDRCYNPKVKRFPNYGGRGITVCDRWLNSFENFLEDMGRRPSINHSIERNENNGNYEPSNCRWATRLEQANNKTNNVSISFNGKTLNLSQWAREINVPVSRIETRFKKNWDLKDVLNPNKYKTGAWDHNKQNDILKINNYKQCQEYQERI